MPTLNEVIDFYETHVGNHLPSYSYKAHWSNYLRTTLGNVQMSELRRHQIWDALWDKYEWPSVRDALEQTKRIFNFAQKAPQRWWMKGPAPKPILDRRDNPLDGVVVNLKSKTSSWKAGQPSAELVYEMTVNSDQAWETAQKKKLLGI